MLDAQLPDPKIDVQPRAAGLLRARVGTAGLEKLRQQGSLKALFPRTTGPVDLVALNTTGGVTGGDRFVTELEVGPGAQLRYATQAAERAYRAQPGEVGQIATRLRLDVAASLFWLPQETLLYDSAALDRRFDADLAADATLIAVEALVFGRRAMGERLTNLRFRDQWRVRRGGRLVFADAVRLDAAIGQLSRPVLASGGGAVAQVLIVSPEAERHSRHPAPKGGAASLVSEGVLFARVIAEDGFELRRALLPYLERLTDTAMPKVWGL
ncbi:urease accessory protein UreD [Aestuariibius insulae]|uniref:urease accessory protein UreD n=1 Tax=Aestuariibius insulae TaxID=2058287 RepID=UPI00345E50B2